MLCCLVEPAILRIHIPAVEVEVVTDAMHCSLSLCTGHLIPTHLVRRQQETDELVRFIAQPFTLRAQRFCRFLESVLLMPASSDVA
jgi:hypothetical protein